MKDSIYIIYTGDDWDREEPEHTVAMQFGYGTWGRLCNKKGIDLYRGSLTWFNSEKKCFEKGWIFNPRSNKWDKVNTDIFPNVVYDKARIYDKTTGDILYPNISAKNQISTYLRSVNTSKFSELLDSKLSQYLVFQELMPHSKILDSGTHYVNNSDEKIVIKKLFGSGGKEVNILDPGEELKIESISLLQNFIKGTKDGELQDVRIVYLGNNPVYALSRKAKKGSLFTNFHQGAKVIFRDLDELEILAAIELNKNKLLPKLEIFDKKVFSVDYIVDSITGQYYLIEINSTPGLDVFDTENKHILEDFLDKLNHYLLK